MYKYSTFPLSDQKSVKKGNGFLLFRDYSRRTYRLLSSGGRVITFSKENVIQQYVTLLTRSIARSFASSSSSVKTNQME